jgi:uncharacterized protein YjbI with pentapeptide repeats
MKKIQSPQAALLHRVYHYRGRDRLAVTVLAGFRITDPGVLVDEAGLWAVAAEGLQPGQALDQGMPKPGGEVLIAGRACAPGGQPVQGLEVGFTLGKISKRLYVFGDRHWTGGSQPAPPLSAPQPFTLMDLTWGRAFGGPGFDANPEGRGLAPLPTPEGLFWPAPNVEYPDQLSTSPQDRPTPAGLGPQGLNWPGRLKNLGTFDHNWLIQDWPGLPEDFKFSFFTLAPPDQQQAGYFNGEEEFTLHGLQTDNRQVASRLPGQRARAFVRNRPRNAQAESFTETPLNLDTVWLFPHLDLGVVIWHGSTPITDDEADDVSLMAAFLESSREAPQPLEHYQALCQIQASKAVATPPARLESAPAAAPAAPLAEAEAAAATPQVAPEPPAAAPMIRDADPRQELPPEVSHYFPPTPPEPADGQPQTLLQYYYGQAAALEARLDEMLLEMGVDPSRLPPEELPPELSWMYPELPEPPAGLSPEELAGFYRSQAAVLEKSLDDHLETLGPDPLLPASDEIYYKIDDSIAAWQKMPGTEDVVRTLQELKQEYEAASSDLAAKQARLAVLEQEQAGAMAAVGAGSGPIDATGVESATAAAGPEAAANAETPRAAYTREDVLAARESGLPGADLAGLDLPGADLSGMDLSGANLTGANMEGAVLARANLTGSNLSQTILAGAVLAGATLTQADLRKSNLVRTQAAGADFSHAKLGEADLSGADLSQADLRGADLRGAGLNRAKLAGVRGQGARAEQADFNQADLRGADFSQSRLSQADLTGARLDQAVFREADLSCCWVSQAQGQGVDLTGADLHEIRSTGQTSLPLVQARGANLTKAYFEESNLARGDFSDATLDRASFIRCGLQDANLSRSPARQADFSHSDLSGANLKSVNLLQGSFRKALLKETDLSGANLFAVDFYKSTLGGTNLDRANLKRTILKMWK